MFRNKIILYILPLIFLSACIKTFTPKIDSDAASKIVVSGKLTNKEGYQTVTISKSIPLSGLDNSVLSNCNVSIWDNLGNKFQLQEYLDGEYRVWMNQEDLNSGTAYHIQIITPDGDELISEPDIMPDVAQIETPNYERSTIYNAVYNAHDNGLQFLIDIDGNESNSSYYLFELDATYEHHALFDREWYYDDTLNIYGFYTGRGKVYHIYPPDSSLYFCWTTERVPEILLLSTENLTENKFKNFNLHFVSFRAPYLTYGYSLLVRQMGLSREAYLYWENMKKNNNQNADLYGKQPVDIQGNIKNITNPEKEVLGFFHASAISELRIFIGPKETNPNPICAPIDIRRLGFREIDPNDYPAFLLNDPLGDYLMYMLPDPCVNCASYHGSTIKPDFWPY
ncbi:MAG: DUF4249 domain-containing protein [Bacteroidales bacterium]|jgi:hypothetical protein|nr:DUF4249 domain-containing protein [Bacteroidales bacterium]